MLYPQRQPSEDKAIDRSFQPNTPIQNPNREQIFQLIDSILSFEACLYHQVLPIAKEENRVTLGMVDPEDKPALDYVERLLSYMNYCLVSVPITTQLHQEMLSAYLKQAGANKPATEKHSIAAGHPAAQTAAKSSEEIASASPNDRPTLILEREEVFVCESEPTTSAPSPTPVASATKQALPALKLHSIDLSSSVEVLKKLPPKRLLQELLGRVLEKGIGRLYFEQNSPQRGRIVCSQDGNLQCVLSDISTLVFQALIGELKLLVHLPLEPALNPKQAEIERFYRQERVLLRLQVMPGKYGERATLQILRGAALEFYQQQQLAHLSSDALAIAEQLQQKLHQLRQRATQSANLHSERYQSLMALDRVLESVEQQLQQLKHPPA